MTPSARISIFFGGLLLMLAAFPVCAQEKTPEQITINSLPLYDLTLYLQKNISEKSIDLGAPFAIEATGRPTKDGKIDPSTFRYIRVEGDERMIDIGKRSVEAFNDSGFFQYLAPLDSKGFRLSIFQNDTDFDVAISAELEGPSRAKSIQIMFNMAINYYSEKISGANADENDKEYLTILKAITIENDKNNLAIKYELPKSAMQELIKKKLSRVWSRTS